MIEEWETMEALQNHMNSKYFKEIVPQMNEYMDKPVEQEKVENFLLKVVNLGLGAVWLGVAPIQERMDKIKQIFGLPEGLEPYALVPVGYPDSEENKFVERFDATRVHYEKWD